MGNVHVVNRGIYPGTPRNYLRDFRFAAAVAQYNAYYHCDYDPVTGSYHIWIDDNATEGHHTNLVTGLVSDMPYLLDKTLTLSWEGVQLNDVMTQRGEAVSIYVQLVPTVNDVWKTSRTFIEVPSYVSCGPRSATFVIPEEIKQEMAPGVLRFQLCVGRSGACLPGASATIRGLNLTIGDKWQPWSPNPEDAMLRLDAIEAKIGITASDPPMVEGPEIMDYPAGG